MDLGLKGKSAIVCASSSGIGRACAVMLAREGANVVINARTAATLEETATFIRSAAPDVEVKTVVGSVVDPAVREALVGAFPAPDIVVNNAGGPPPGDFHDWSREDWIAAIDQNMLSAIELIRMTIDGMAERGFGRIVNITSSAVRVPIPVIGMSNATRAGLTNFVFGLVPQYSSRNVTINNLLPGAFNTNRFRDNKNITLSNPVAGRIGDPEEMGAMCAFLCGQYAGYISGQNILMDGGMHPGNF